MIIPKSYGINWTIVESSEPEQLKEIQTYQVKGIESGDTTLDARRHPLLFKLFDSVTYDSAMIVNHLGLGVTRSNGVVIQPMHGHKSVAYTHRFTTQGLRFKISNFLKNLQ